jgi:L-2-hydroxyglutarate oxidase LhgO
VYPVPDPATGTLGIHATIDMQGNVRFGPDAVWTSPEGGERDEGRKCNLHVDASRVHIFESSIRRYYPTLPPNSLVPDYAGIRPKMVGPGQPHADRWGRNLHDFMIDGPRSHGLEGLVNIYGIESPGLTSSMGIAELVAQELTASSLT